MSSKDFCVSDQDSQTRIKESGTMLGKIERYDDAIASFDRAIAINPDYPFPWGSRGSVLMQLRQFEAAHESLDRAISLKPEDAQAHYDKACCYALQNQAESAISTLQQAILLNSKCREAAKIDSSFDQIRQDDRFQALISEWLLLKTVSTHIQAVF